MVTGRPVAAGAWRILRADPLRVCPHPVVCHVPQQVRQASEGDAVGHQQHSLPPAALRMLTGAGLRQSYGLS